MGLTLGQPRGAVMQDGVRLPETAERPLATQSQSPFASAKATGGPGTGVGPGAGYDMRQRRLEQGEFHVVSRAQEIYKPGNAPGQQPQQPQPQQSSANYVGKQAR